MKSLSKESEELKNKIRTHNSMTLRLNTSKEKIVFHLITKKHLK